MFSTFSGVMCDGNAKTFYFYFYGQWKTNLIETKMFSLRVENGFQNATPHSYTQQTTTNVFFDNFPKNESFPETFFNILYLVNPFLL